MFRLPQYNESQLSPLEWSAPSTTRKLVKPSLFNLEIFKNIYETSVLHYKERNDGSQLVLKFPFIFNFVYFIVFLDMESIPVIIINSVIALDYGSLVATYISIFYAALYILLSFESRLNINKRK